MGKIYKTIRSGNMVEQYQFDSDDYYNGIEALSFGYQITPDTPLDDKRRFSLGRARKNIFRFIECQKKHFSLSDFFFLTLTFADEKYTDLDLANKQWSLFTQRLNRHCKKYGYDNLKYISVPEFTKKGRVHYHVLFFNFSRGMFEKQSLAKIWSLGHIHLRPLKKIRSVAGYISKYLTKDTISHPMSKKTYFTSKKGIKRPLKKISTSPLTNKTRGLELLHTTEYQSPLGRVVYKRYYKSSKN